MSNQSVQTDAMTIDPDFEESLKKYEIQLFELNEKMNAILKKLPNALELIDELPEDYEKLRKFVVEHCDELKPLINGFMSLFFRGFQETANSEVNCERFKKFLNDSDSRAISQVMTVWSREELPEANIDEAGLAKCVDDK